MVTATKPGIEGLIERTTIEFPRYVVPSELKPMFEYVACELGGVVRVEYSLDNVVVINAVCGRDSTGRNSNIKENTRSGKGEIDKSIEHVSFELNGKWLQNDSVFKGLRFFTPPGYGLHEIRPECLELMDNVRKHLNDYFEMMQK